MIPPRRLRDPSKFPLLALLLRFVLLLTMTKAQQGQCTVPKVLWPGSYNLVFFNITCTKSTIASVLLVQSKSHEHKLNNFQPFFIENWIQHWILGIISVDDKMVQAKPIFVLNATSISREHFWHWVFSQWQNWQWGTQNAPVCLPWYRKWFYVPY